MLKHACFALGLLLACGTAAYAQEECEPIPGGQITGGEVSAQEFQRLLACAKQNLAEAEKRLNDLSAVKVEGFARERDALAKTLEAQTADLKEARAEIERLVAERDRLTADLAKARGDNEKAKARIATLQNEIERMAADLNKAGTIIDEANGKIAALQGVIDQMSADIQAAKDQIATLGGQIETLTAALEKARAEAKAQIAALGDQIIALNEAAKKASDEAKGQIVALIEAAKKASADAKAQIAALGDQIVALNEAAKKASDEAKAQDAALGAKIDELTAELKSANEKITELTNQIAALTDKLTGYRAQFFARLKTILQGLPGIVIVDDHVIVQAEVLFAVGSEKLDAEGQATILKVAAAVRELQAQIPPTMKWALQVNGHTDIQPIRGGRFASNWELSTARALTVVRLLQDKCVSPDHLIAAGFGEYQPLNDGQTAEILKHNRRIEMLLTDAGLGPLIPTASLLPKSCSKP